MSLNFFGQKVFGSEQSINTFAVNKGFAFLREQSIHASRQTFVPKCRERFHAFLEKPDVHGVVDFHGGSLATRSSVNLIFRSVGKLG